ncbi:MAG: Zinc metalloprotease [Dehalococcoidia bacterium]|nr:Zinc metalloprotease [Dehalococcoidia bacterium]
MNNAFNIGKVFGISLRLHYSWFFIFILVTTSLAFGGLYPPGLPLWQGMVGGVITSLLFFASVVAHEITHSLVARRYGIPVHSITLFIFGGVAKITKEADRPGAEAVMAAAGPFSSFVIAGIFGALWLAVHQSGIEVATSSIYWLAYINLSLGAFNLIPGFPLDGGRVLRAILWKSGGDYRKATRMASLTGRGVGYLFILGGLGSAFLLQSWFQGIWLTFIGWFLENAASSSYRQVALRDTLLTIKAANVMTTDCMAVLSSMPLMQIVREHILPAGRRCFLVTTDSRLEGIITLSNIRAIPRTRWETTTARDAMTPADRFKTVKPDDDAYSVLSRMEENDLDYIPVADGEQVLGLISRESLLHHMRTRAELGI